jgi:hypothetical protein
MSTVKGRMLYTELSVSMLGVLVYQVNWRSAGCREDGLNTMGRLILCGSYPKYLTTSFLGMLGWISIELGDSACQNHRSQARSQNVPASTRNMGLKEAKCPTLVK